jgi:preprotein translocase subunit SecB
VTDSNPNSNALPDAPGFVIARHYLLDLSVENPYGRLNEALVDTVETSDAVQVDVFPPVDNSPVYRVDVTIRLTAQTHGREFFVSELRHRAEVLLHQVPPEDVGHILNVQVPEALLPACSGILMHTARFAGYPGMVIQGLDFDSAYRTRLAAEPQ